MVHFIKMIKEEHLHHFSHWFLHSTFLHWRLASPGFSECKHMFSLVPFLSMVTRRSCLLWAWDTALLWTSVSLSCPAECPTVRIWIWLLRSWVSSWNAADPWLPAVRPQHRRTGTRWSVLRPDPLWVLMWNTHMLRPEPRRCFRKKSKEHSTDPCCASLTSTLIFLTASWCFQMLMRSQLMAYCVLLWGSHVRGDFVFPSVSPHAAEKHSVHNVPAHRLLDHFRPQLYLQPSHYMLKEQVWCCLWNTRQTCRARPRSLSGLHLTSKVVMWLQDNWCGIYRIIMFLTEDLMVTENWLNLKRHMWLEWKKIRIKKRSKKWRKKDQETDESEIKIHD